MYIKLICLEIHNIISTKIISLSYTAHNTFITSLFNSISYNTLYFKKNNIALSKISRESNTLLIKSNIL